MRPGVSRSGKPAYKSQEEQYQEIQELRQELGHLREENSTLRTRTRRLEEDLARRDRQIQQLMDPTKVLTGGGLDQFSCADALLLLAVERKERSCMVRGKVCGYPKHQLYIYLTPPATNSSGFIVLR